MSRAELQHLQETNSADQYFARVEGRNQEGRMEYRAQVMEFPSEQYDQWAVFWGISEAELFDWELRLLKSGFIRDNMQVCADSSGKVCHQIVWLKPAGSPDVDDTPPVAPVTSEQVIAGQSIPPEPIVEPPQNVTAPPPVAIAEPEPEPKPAAKKAIHIVKPGDTLGKIAKLRGTTVAGLKSANGLKSDIVRIGQKLTIPPKE
jgi:hypothetical protein